MTRPLIVSCHGDGVVDFLNQYELYTKREPNGSFTRMIGGCHTAMFLCPSQLELRDGSRRYGASVRLERFKDLCKEGACLSHGVL